MPLLLITQIRYSVNSQSKVTSRKEKTRLGFEYIKGLSLKGLTLPNVGLQLTILAIAECHYRLGIYNTGEQLLLLGKRKQSLVGGYQLPTPAANINVTTGISRGLGPCTVLRIRLASRVTIFKATNNGYIMQHHG